MAQSSGKNIKGVRPLLIVMSAPSGAGKSTLCRLLLERMPKLQYSISCTTRKPRGAEVNGQHYHFLSEDEFRMHVEQHNFLEHATVHGYRYGTLAGPVRTAMETGHNVLMDIDVQGAAQVRERLNVLPEGDVLKAGFVDVFVAPPSMEELRHRLESRGEDSAEVIRVRLENAGKEMARSNEFMHRIVNDRLEDALARLLEVLDAAARPREGQAAPKGN